MNTANHMDELVKRAVKTASVEKPGKDFTYSVMNKIEGLSLEKNDIIQASPLISWKGWIIIGATIITIFSILLLSGPSSIDFSFLDTYLNHFNHIDIQISIPKIFLIGLFAFVFFFIIEVLLISRKISKSEISL